VFGLYKYADRQMLSAKAEEWYIKVCVESHDAVLICVREVTRTKAWNDATKSSLYRLQCDLETVEKHIAKYKILTHEKDIVAEILVNFPHERIECKNETDMQETLSAFLAPQEVFLSTAMLLQWSENVFELAPADRISLFKEIFGLMSIDSATDRINDEKKSVSAILKAKKMTDDVDKKLQNYLSQLKQLCATLWEDAALYKDLLDEISLIEDKISITWYALSPERHTHTQKILLEQTQKYNTLQQTLWGIEAREENKKKLLAEQASTIKEIQSITQQISLIEKNLATDTTWDITQEKTKRQNAYNTRLESLPKARFSDTFSTFQQIYDHTNELIQQWKLLREQERSVKNRIQQLKEKHIENQNIIASYTTQRAQLEKDYESKKKFACAKIGDNCPFIEQINDGLFLWLKRNIDSLSERIQEYQKKIDDENILVMLQGEEDKIAGIQSEIETIWSSLYVKNHQIIRETKNTYDELLQQQNALSQKEKQLAAQISLREEQKQKLLSLVEQQKNLEKTRFLIEDKIAEAQKNTQDQEIATTHQYIVDTQKKITSIHSLQQLLWRIDDLIAQFKELQREIKQLEEKEKLLTDLYRIFSKEIMIKVLEDALPFFAEYVNNLLAKIVSFTLHFQPKKTTWDKLELDITIRDSHGERAVKSLSGWQKAVLRLAWILWVAQMTRTKQLFLDETINNIDQETISHVADMIQDYTKMNDISLYLVTHSSQLQSMDIWTRVITPVHVSS
jgi:DNA repair exonuclease SbcCD ATPase subunit